MKLVLSAITASVLLLSGCAARVNSDVTTFHQELMPAGETIRVVAADPNNNQSLEFRSYATRINDELRKLGYTPVTEPDVVADLIAEVDYSVEEGPTQIYSDRSSNYVRYHFGFGRYYSPRYFGPYDSRFFGPRYYDPRFGRYYGPRHLAFYDPFYDPFWDEPEVYSTPTYQRNLDLYIFKADGDHERLFEGRVESNGTESALPEVMPYLITAMFSNFPGESGMTKMVTIEKDL